MKVQGMKLAWIVVKDLDAAIKFYTESVGLTLMNKNTEHNWAELSGPDGFVLGMGQESPYMDNKAGSNAVMTIEVDDIIAARNSFEKKGITLLGDIMEVPGHVKMQTFMDSDRNVMQLVQCLS